VQYKVEKAGEGVTVQEHDSPLLRYTGKFLDGTVFGSSKEDELISLDETLPGFTKGIIGMKEGEKRTLFIHPDLGYGTSGYLPPNSLLTFEVEVLKANAAPAMDALTAPGAKSNPEIASPLEPAQALR
jgi:peptidylprolyl isomerase